MTVGKGYPVNESLINKKSVETYREARGFPHKGVTGSESVDRLNEAGQSGITPLPKEFTTTPEKVVKENVVERPAGDGTGMSADAGKVKNTGQVNKIR